MLFAGPEGTLELRAGQDGRRVIRGKFPYNRWAVLSDGGKTGRPKKERFAPGAFRYSLENTKTSPIHLLSGHSYDRPLASTEAGTLSFKDTAEALTFDAIIVEEVAKISWVQDLFQLILAGLSIGLSPGFRIPPERAVEVAEKIEQEAYDPARGMFGAVLRTILEAILFEMSIVTRPAYDNATVEMRSWQPDEKKGGLYLPAMRWR